MVSKIAVIALVVIVACPILLGYALNVNETTATEYKTNDDSVNVTPLLKTGTIYTTAKADTYQLNTSFYGASNTFDKPIYAKQDAGPRTTLSALSGRTANFSGTDTRYLSSYPVIVFNMDYQYEVSKYVQLQIYKTGSVLVATIDHVIHVYADISGVVQVTTLTGVDSVSLNDYTVADLHKITITVVGFSSVPLTWYREYPNLSHFIDISGGFYFSKKNQNNQLFIDLPNETYSVLMSINLNSINDANYSMNIVSNTNLISGYKLVKTTVGTDVSYKILRTWDNSEVFDLYYDPDRTDNTYQFYKSFVKVSEQDIGNANPERTYNQHVEFRYVGGWPTLMGPANSYMTYSEDVEVLAHNLPEITLKSLSLSLTGAPNTFSPTVRMDGADFYAFAEPVIENKQYDPAAFKTNPSTKISDFRYCGPSLTFGGTEYVTNKGNITIGVREFSLNNMVLDSIPSASGSGYDNRINGYVVSTTASPSTISFNGKWSANIITTSMEGTTVTSTEWIPGEFAWDGIDTNFLLMGVFAAFAAMVGLGIYAKNRRMAVIPLVIVCGGAALMFLMLI